jgi:hypothetical protein
MPNQSEHAANTGFKPETAFLTHFGRKIGRANLLLCREWRRTAPPKNNAVFAGSNMRRFHRPKCCGQMGKPDLNHHHEFEIYRKFQYNT